MAEKRVTLKDVAQAAGVSTGTVSMVLNDSPLIADATKLRVQTVLSRLGYVYDRAAGNLRGNRSRIIGFSICDLVNPYFADVTAGIQEALEELGRVLVLGNCEESISRQNGFLQTLRQYRVEGMMLTPAISTPKAHIQQLLEWNVPVVQVTRYVAGVQTDYVGNDNVEAGQMATQHLIDLGHERIAYLGRNRLTSTGRHRYEGYKSALKKAKLKDQEDWTVECQATREAGFREIVGLRKLASAPTAIVCFNDPVAFGAMLGLRSIGEDVGRDCSIIGMDDVAEAALWQPGLTTIAIGRDEIGRAAGRLLMSRLENPQRPVERVTLTPKLIVRGSTGPAKPSKTRKSQSSK